MHILFLCTGNSCRSIIGEALLASMAPAGVTAHSAGSHPTGFVHPRALAALQQAGIATEGLHSKSWNDLPVQPDVVLTLCADAAGEVCPVIWGTPLARSHWGMPDPAKVQGDESTVAAAFSETFIVLRKRIDALVKQLKVEPDMDEMRLQEVLDSIVEGQS